MNSDGRMPDLDPRFDAELSRAARALVTEELPRGVLDAGLVPASFGRGSVRARRSAPAYANFAAAVVLLLATAIALAPGGIPPASPTPTTGGSAPSSPAPAASPSPGPSQTPRLHGSFRSTSDIEADFARLTYACAVGNVLLPTGPSPSAMVKEGAICTSPADAGPFMAAVIVGEAADGTVVELHVKGDLTGEDTPAAREALASAFAKAIAIAAQGQVTANGLASWVLAAVPLLGRNSSNSTEQLGFIIKVVRSSSGSYQLGAYRA